MGELVVGVWWQSGIERVTTPVLPDNASRQVVSNESSEIPRAWEVAR